VAVTLLCALPIYVQVAGRSFAGLGSIAMLENLLPGWWGKFMVLLLLEFATTDFVITIMPNAAAVSIAKIAETALALVMCGQHIIRSKSIHYGARLN